MVNLKPILSFVVMIFIFSGIAYTQQLPDPERTYTVKDARINQQPAKEITFTQLSKEYQDTALKLRTTTYYGNANIQLVQNITKSGTKQIPYNCHCWNYTLENKTIIETCETCYGIEEYTYSEFVPINAKTYTLKNNNPIYETFTATKIDALPGGTWGYSIWTEIDILGFTITDATWWNESWSYRAPIDINHSSAQTDYQVFIDLNTSVVGANFNWSQENSLRFTSYAGNILSHWVRDWNETAQTAEIWIKTTINDTVYMYYGNPSVSSTSNVTNTFICHHLAESTTGWTDRSGTPTLALDGTIKKEGDYSLKLTHTGTGIKEYNFASATTPARLDFYLRVDDATGDGRVSILELDESAISTFAIGQKNEWLQDRPGAVWTDVMAVSDNTWYLISMRNIDWTADTYDLWVDGVEKTTGSAFQQANANFQTIWLAMYTAQSVWFDELLGMKYVSGVSYSIGTEESTNTPPTYSSTGHTTTTAGASCTFHIQYNDTEGLHPNGQYIFSTNNTGTWTNESPANFTTTPEWANATKTLNLTGGLSIGYRWYAFDNGTVHNNTPIFILITVDATAPTSNNPPDASCNTSASATIAWILSDETGPGQYTTYRNGTIQNNSIAWVNNTSLDIPINTTTVGVWNYTITYNDSSGNPGTPDTVMITITPPDSTPPNVTISTASGTTSDTTPDITFTATDNIDTNMSYELFIDGSGYGTGYVSNSSSTTIQPNATLSIGAHTIYINATDDGSNTGQSNTITLTVSKTFTLSVFDELTQTRLPAIVKISNSSITKYYAIGSKYKESELGDANVLIETPEYSCDMDLTTRSDIRGDAGGSDFIYCYLAIPPADNQNYTAKVALNQYARLRIYLYNSDLADYELMITQTGTGGGATYYLNFTANNSANKYTGLIRYKLEYLTVPNTAIFFIFETYNSDQQSIDSLYLDYEYLTAGTTTITIDDPPALGEYIPRDYYFYFTNSSAETINAYLLKSSQGAYSSYITLTSLESAIENVLITVNKHISGAYVVVAQKKTDGSGTAQLFLDPTNTYQFIFTHSEYDTLIKTLTPALSTYKIYLSKSTSINFTALFDDIYYQILPITTVLDNSTAQAFNFTIISTNSSLEYQGMNISYNGTQYFSNHVTGSPAGSTINATLDIHNWTGTFTLTAYFKKSGYDEEIITKTYRVHLISPQGYTIYEAIQNANNDTAGFGMFTFGLVAIILTMIAIAIVLPYSVVGGGIVGLAVLGILTYVNWFSWQIYFLVCLVTVSIIYLQGDR